MNGNFLVRCLFLEVPCPHFSLQAKNYGLNLKWRRVRQAKYRDWRLRAHELSLRDLGVRSSVGGGLVQHFETQLRETTKTSSMTFYKTLPDSPRLYCLSCSDVVSLICRIKIAVLFVKLTKYCKNSKITYACSNIRHIERG